ncbi:MAG: HAMP domain-containing sensor histidine kinase [Eubacteriales bacterium]|nr:HAMP domain-containing sensor histidine kinase [Eubacteriales bacterium]
MFKKLRNKAVISFCIFLLLVVGGTSLTYYFFAEDLYVAKKKKVMNEAFQTLQTMEMEDELLEEHSFFKKYEAESFFVMICDESFQTVYVSGSKTKERIMRNKMKKEMEMYREDAKAELDEEETGTKIILRGKMQQKGKTYYVYIYEDTDIIRKSVAYASHFLAYVLLILIVLGGIFAYIASVRIVKPIEEMNRVTKKIAENDFSVRVKVPVSEDELGCLACNINHMAEKIQKDMNELSNYNYLLMKKNRDMAQFEDMRKTFVTNVTHELKTPLAIISSQVQMLQYDESKKEYYYESIMEEIEKMSHMLSQLLGNSFLENKRKQQEMERQDISKLIWNLIPKYEAWFSTKKIKVVSQIESKCYAKADTGQIEQAVGNYMMNAYNHTKTGKEVKLSLRKEGEDLYLSVYNEGEKVTEKEKIWEKFIQLERQTGNESRVGLGLYIVKDIVQAHNGQCGVNNTENGAEFWIRIPAA